jgi:hypothetical protein
MYETMLFASRKRDSLPPFVYPIIDLDKSFRQRQVVSSRVRDAMIWITDAAAHKCSRTCIHEGCVKMLESWRFDLVAMTHLPLELSSLAILFVSCSLPRRLTDRVLLYHLPGILSGRAIRYSSRIVSVEFLING